MQFNIHHIRYAVKNVESFSRFLVTQLQFRPYAVQCDSPHNSSSTIVLKHQDIIFVIDKRLETQENADQSWFCSGNTYYPVDTVCDICLYCSDIENRLQPLRFYDKTCIVTDMSELHDSNGIVKYAVVKPPVGNIQHTLLDLTNYTGNFLPGFKVIENTHVSSPSDLLQTIDHIAYALNVGETDDVMKWYCCCMGFDRLMINIDEDESQGFVVQEGNQGLRLKALLGPLQKLEKHEDSLAKRPCDVPKLVFCEALDYNSSMNQVSHFVKLHAGAGVQHIAFSTNDIVSAVSEFKLSGLKCVLPPEAYYNDSAKHEEIQKLDYDVDTLKCNNILLESHHASEQKKLNTSVDLSSIAIEDQVQNMMNSHWFIMQVFTTPVFAEKTLFFEIIQRFQTLSGFGAGNIGALWRAVEKEMFNN